jgi:hypothetical protein
VTWHIFFPAPVWAAGAGWQAVKIIVATMMTAKIKHIFLNIFLLLLDGEKEWKPEVETPYPDYNIKYNLDSRNWQDGK